MRMSGKPKIESADSRYFATKAFERTTGDEFQRGEPMGEYFGI
jgi:hypothetical protein